MLSSISFYVIILFASLTPTLSSTHTNNWAVIVDTSRYWFNYRHVANALSLYRTVKQQGIPDSQIILMLADDMPCNRRNRYKGQVFNDRKHSLNLYSEDVEVDYRGTECSVHNFLRVLTGRHTPDTPASKRLPTDEHSNIFIYMTGHGGDQFLKFHDKNEIQTQDIADAFEQMHKQKRYNEILFMVDTCQAATLHEEFYSPNIIGVGSSKKGQDSLSYEHDGLLGVSVIDRFTYYTLAYFEEQAAKKKVPTIKQLFKSYKKIHLKSDAGWRDDLFGRSLDQVPVTDFFGAVVDVALTLDSYDLVTNTNITFAQTDELLTTQYETVNPSQSSTSIQAKFEYDESRFYRSIGVLSAVTAIVFSVEFAIS